jgi:lipid II:glycine glycyltransferase (peptidoglycan interpeptide bridge formation enzyme)
MYEAVYGGPVCLAGFEFVLGPLLKHQEKLSRAHTSYVVTPPGFDPEILRESGYAAHGAETVLLDPRGTPDELWSKIGSRRRNDVRRAEKKGVKVGVGGLDQVRFLHEALCDTLARVGREPLKLSFFCELLRVMMPLRLATFLVAEVDGQPVAGAIMLHSGSLTVFWSGASSELGRRTTANVLLQWRAILHAAERGSQVYDLLGIDPRLPGVSAFKEGFAGSVARYCSAVKRTPVGEVVRSAGAFCHPVRTIQKLLRSRK